MPGNEPPRGSRQQPQTLRNVVCWVIDHVVPIDYLHESLDLATGVPTYTLYGHDPSLSIRELWTSLDPVGLSANEGSLASSRSHKWTSKKSLLGFCTAILLPRRCHIRSLPPISGELAQLLYSIRILDAIKANGYNHKCWSDCFANSVFICTANTIHVLSTRTPVFISDSLL